MAIVAELRLPNATVLISDDAYAGISKEQMEARRNRARAVAYEILMRHEAKDTAKRQKQNA